MEREYTSPSAMGYAQQQQQQQFGGYPPPQHQQFPPSVHRPPFIPPHPPLQQFPYHQQFPPHQPPPHHPHLAHLQQPPPNFPPHFPPHLVPSPFRGPFDSSPPPPAPPPSDPELQKRIDKLVEYSAKNGPEFEAMIREKQQDNPDYSFLFGGEGHNYYRYKLFISTRSHGGPFNPMFPGASPPLMHPPPNPMMNVPPAAGAAGPMMGGPQMLQHPFPPFYDHQQQPFPGHGRPEYEQSSSKPFKAMSGPLPPDVAMELNNVLNSLSGTKESIKGAKTWFMQRSNFAPALAEALRDRVYAVDDCERQLHIVYLVNDILFDSLQRRTNHHELDNEALAFRPILGSILARVYHNPQEKEENQSRLQKILQFWASKEVYDQNTIYALEGEMIGGPAPNSFSGMAKDLTDPSMVPGQQIQQTANVTIPQWQQDKQVLQDHQLPDKQAPMVPSMPQQPLVNQQLLPGSHPSSSVLGSIPLANQQPPAYMLPTPPASSIGEKVPPYPLFPPGLIPGMVRKMQIGSGVPYSPMSPLDIPTVIPPSNISPTETLERVSKFFKEIGEVNPSEGPMGSKDAEDDDYDYKRDSPVRKGGACIPPPMNLQVDPDTGTYPDGTVETKPGSSSSGRLGLGATANPNEVSQYDDVYTSYRKQRSTNYHSSMSLRAATR